MVFNLTVAEVIAPFTPSRGIPPEKVRAFRERRGWTHEQMADEVWASPLEVAAWEAGTVRVPAGCGRSRRQPPWHVPFVMLIAAAALTRLGELPGVPHPASVWVEAIVFFWVGERTGRYAGRRLQRRPYATGLLSGMVGMLAAMLTWKLRAPDPDLADPAVLAVCAVVAVLFGLLGGWIRDVGDDDTGPADAETPPRQGVKEREA